MDIILININAATSMTFQSTWIGVMFNMVIMGTLLIFQIYVYACIIVNSILVNTLSVQNRKKLSLEDVQVEDIMTVMDQVIQ